MLLATALEPIMLHTHITAAEAVAAPEDAPPPIAEQALAGALSSPRATKPKLTIAQLHAAFLATEHDNQALSRVRDDLRDRRDEVRTSVSANMDAAEATVPLPDALRIPNTNPAITAGFIQFADGTRKDFEPRPTDVLTSSREIDDHVARNPGVDGDALHKAFGVYSRARFDAAVAAAPELVAANKAFEVAAAACRPVSKERGRLFDAVLRLKARNLAELRMQAEVLARFGDGEVKRHGGFRFTRQLYDYEAVRLLERVTDLIAKEAKSAAPPPPSKIVGDDDVDELAAMAFEPLDSAILAISGKDLLEIAESHTPTILIATRFASKTKAELIEAARPLMADPPEQNALIEFCDAAGHAETTFRAWADICASGRARVMISMASLLSKKQERAA